MHHYPSLSIIIHHYPSLSIIIHHYPSLSIIIHHYPSLSHIHPCSPYCFRVFGHFPGTWIPHFPYRPSRHSSLASARGSCRPESREPGTWWWMHGSELRCKCVATARQGRERHSGNLPAPKVLGRIVRMALVKGYRFTWGGGHYSAKTSCFW